MWEILLLLSINSFLYVQRKLVELNYLIWLNSQYKKSVLDRFLNWISMYKLTQTEMQNNYTTILISLVGSCLKWDHSSLAFPWRSNSSNFMHQKPIVNFFCTNCTLVWIYRPESSFKRICLLLLQSYQFSLECFFKAGSSSRPCNF